MRSLPNVFCVFNHEGIHRVTMSFSRLLDFDKAIQEMVKSNVVLSLSDKTSFLNSRNEEVIMFTYNEHFGWILRLRKPFEIKTVYCIDNEAIVPCFHKDYAPLDSIILGEQVLIFDPKVWNGYNPWIVYSDYGYYFVIQYNNQLYNFPLPNIYEDGRLCTGSSVINEGISVAEHVENTINHLSNSAWNSDLLSDKDIARKLFRWSPVDNTQLDPIWDGFAGLKICSGEIPVKIFTNMRVSNLPEIDYNEDQEETDEEEVL